VFPQARRFLSARHIELLGMPVRVAVDEAWVKRSSILNAPTSDSLRTIQEGSLDGAQASIFTFFVFGGSQGARALNRVVFDLVKQHSQDLRQQGIRIVHQIGRHDWQEAQACYAGLSSEWVEYHEFIQDMPRYYEQADVVMCRAGASSVAEVMAFGLVTIFVPLPLADSHQKSNAQSLVEAGAALMIEQKELTVEKLFASLLALKHDPSKRRAMQEKMLELYRPRASVRMAELILQVCRHEI
jgi:UDP-N-acetylglucosamine--N-acetylmuramyl-(pentapeptide) pyrophosphoryl-undecaprenol N-acetylglucosamine transferase